MWQGGCEGRGLGTKHARVKPCASKVAVAGYQQGTCEHKTYMGMHHALAPMQLRTMAERLRTLTSQQAAMSTLCTGLSAECKRLGHEVEGLRRELSEGSLRREGSDPSLADILR